MDFLDKLIEDQKSLKRIREIQHKEIIQKEKKIPDALVLIIRNIKCKTCGEVYRVPNHNVLFRFDRNLVKVKFWLDRFNSILKREIIEHDEELLVCDKCLKGKFFSLEDFELEKKR